MNSWFKFSTIIAILFTSTQASAYAYPQLPGRLFLETGAYESTQGRTQTVNISGLIGDEFNVSHRHDINSVFGVGLLIDGLRHDRFGLDYGINAIYFAKTKVSGTITQEFLFTNLAYRYYVSHLPVYVFAKGFMMTNDDHWGVTADVGIGPNFMNTNLYNDMSLDGITQPDHAFEGNFSTTVFSAMAGIGLKFNVGKLPLEIGYRYLYLGQGYFNPRSSQILNKLTTGDNTAQTLMVTVFSF